MKRRGAMVLAVGVIGAWCFATAADAAPVDLLEALGRGLVTAEFRGAGDTGVTGTVVRQTAQPLELTVSPGTVFRVQFGGGGYQGISTFEPTPIDLTAYRIAQVFVPGGCSNFGLKAPGPSEVMVATGPPNERVAKLAQAIAAHEPDRSVAQIAVWAVANDTPKWTAQRYAARLLGPGATKEAVEARATQLLSRAEALVTKAGLDPKKFRAFR